MRGRNVQSVLQQVFINNNFMESLALIGLGVVGVTQVIKMLGVPSMLLPLMAALLGIALSLGITGLTIEAGILGLVEGLTATGFVNFYKENLNKPATGGFVNNTVNKSTPQK